MQTPPIYSALKKDGRPLYSYARAGETVDIPPRAVTIRSIELLDFDSSTFRILVRCSKGTYIRVLAEDIGRSLGCGAMLSGLRRDGVGEYDLSTAITFESLELLTSNERLSHLLPPDGLVAVLPVLTLDLPAMRLFMTGRRPLMVGDSGFYRMYYEEGRFLGLGELSDGELLPKRLMSEVQPALE
jgi:tRNA pseudouridine55 synthase